MNDNLVPITGSVAMKKQRGARSSGLESKLYNGRIVTWKRIIVPAGEVEKRTTVFGENERIQRLLSRDALADIIDTLSPHGNDEPAIGRILKDGLIESADGSRRRMSTIYAATPYVIDVADLTNEEMLHLSETGNIYLAPSVYEQGLRFVNLQSKLELNDSQLEAHLKSKGEKVSRRNIARYKKIALLPIEIIEAFQVANDCSVDMGEKLYQAWEAVGGVLVVRAKQLNTMEQQETDPKKIFQVLMGETENIKKSEPVKKEKFHKLAYSKKLKNGGTAIELNPEISNEKLETIKKFIEQTLNDAHI